MNRWRMVLICGIIALAMVNIAYFLDTYSSQVLPVFQRSIPLDRTKYRLDASYSPQTDELTGSVTVLIPHNKAIDLSELYFRLYPNVFANWNYNQISKPTKPGFLKVTDIKVNGKAVDSKLEENDTVLGFKLPKDLSMLGNLSVEMKYKLRIPRGGTRLNTFKSTAFLAQWYPMLAVKDKEGWHKEPYTPVGDAFYTEIADFDVTFNVPKGYKIISAGEQINNKITQNNVRDFAAVITKDYKYISGNVDNKVVKLWYMPGMEDVSPALHKAAVSSLQFFSKNFGPYPYKELDVVLGDTGYGVAGMEYPGLVTSLPRIETPTGVKPAVNVVAHEVAHQWWYGMVGSNQCKEPWLDEGLTSFSEFWFMKKEMKEDNSLLLKHAVTQSNRAYLATGITSAELLQEYPDNLYALMVYLRPAAMMFALIDEFGEEKVAQVMHEYYEKYKFKTATTTDFKNTATEVLGKDMTKFFGEWLHFSP